MKRFLTTCTAIVSIASILQASAMTAAAASGLANLAMVTPQPIVTSGAIKTPADVSANYINPDSEPTLSNDQIAALVRQKIKYVFVIFNENRSFDSEFGTFPGVNGLFSDGYAEQQTNGVGKIVRDVVRATDNTHTPGFTQVVTDAANNGGLDNSGNGFAYTVQPFRIGLDQGATAVDSVDHSHGNFFTINSAQVLKTGLAYKINVAKGDTSNKAHMDQFSQGEFNARASNFTSTNTDANIRKGVQFSRLVMAHTDCEVTPFFWNWASRFTIFDNIFATEDTPSTPNAIAMIAGQAGETQWVKHGVNGVIGSNAFNSGTTPAADTVFPSTAYNSGSTVTVPIYNDPQPFYGSQFDATSSNARQPSSPTDSSVNASITPNQTYATVPLTLMGNSITGTLAQNLSTGSPKADLIDIQQDIPFIQHLNHAPVSWRWYQEGYGLEATDAVGVTSSVRTTQYTGNGTVSHHGYVLHHNGAAYFGYIANTPSVAANMKGLTDFFTDMKNNSLPNGGVFYIRGGYTNQSVSNNANMQSAIDTRNDVALSDQDKATVKLAKNGDDDHPSYSDHQITETLMANIVNAIAGNANIWKQSAIVITYDESDGFYDHVAPRILSYGPDSLPQSRGVRIPLMLISPYARAHVAVHAEGDHNAVIQTINAIFNEPALASLPDEAQALAIGNSGAFNQFGPPGFQQKYLGPRDINSPTTDSLLQGFSPLRLQGKKPILPAEYAMINYNNSPSMPAKAVKIPNLVATRGKTGCSLVGIVPEDVQQGIVNTIPGATTVGSVSVGPFNALPSTLPAYNAPTP